ncbi:restriction endonuclease subunit S [Lentisalinibacter sediminis]|uniref:restriction endonuclease subunit S n=1 Tax=Lentisalinibacter sediminis TaxID=2992237 RepID=UPI003866E389
MSYRLKYLLQMKYGDALASGDRLPGNISVYGSNGAIGTHSVRNTGIPAIIVGRKGSHGKVTWAADGGFCIDTALYIDNRSCKGHLRYAYYLLQTLGLDQSSKDSAVPGLDRFEAHNRQISQLDIESQKSIADFLDRETARIDQLIQKKERLVEVVDEKRSSMITAAVTGRVDPAAAGHSPPKGIAKHGQLWFDALPSDWSVRRIKTISPVMRGASPRPIDDPAYFDERGEYAWVRISDVTASKGLLLETAQRLSERGAAKSVKLGIGELFLSIAGSVGKPCITGIKACIHDGFVYFPFLPKDSQKFLYWIFESHECFSGLGKLGTQLNLNTETVGNIAIPFPPISTQRTLAEFLDDRIAEIDRLRERMLNSVDRLREFRAALITAAVTGQIDVKTWGKKGTTDRRLDQIEESMSA